MHFYPCSAVQCRAGLCSPWKRTRCENEASMVPTMFLLLHAEGWCLQATHSSVCFLSIRARWATYMILILPQPDDNSAATCMTGTSRDFLDRRTPATSTRSSSSLTMVPQHPHFPTHNDPDIGLLQNWLNKGPRRSRRLGLSLPQRSEADG